ncbi:unnamed protein product [Rotaria sp. Silwood1]|nr:unnamed protein product [Rotaria sp. Silwood1]
MLVRLLNPRQVFLLKNDTTTIQALSTYLSLNNTRICISDGDDTVSLVLNHLVNEFPRLKNPPASICSLDTGNHLSSVLGWGYRYELRRLLKTLTQITRAHPVSLDRWKIQIEILEMNASSKQYMNIRRRFFSFMDHPKFIRDANQPLYDNHRTAIRKFFFNYISFGFDAAVVLDFHVRRTRNPFKFTLPFKNKILYINEARKYFKEFAFGMAWNLSAYIRLICDRQDLTDSMQHCHSLAVLNTPSFGSGTRLWGRISTKRNTSQLNSQRYDDSFDQTSSSSFQTHDFPVNDQKSSRRMTFHNVTHPTMEYFKTRDFGDRNIQVFSLNIRQMALIHMSFCGNRIAQCSQTRIELSHPMPVHMDGEPFYLAGSVADNITHAGQVMVLRNENR